MLTRRPPWALHDALRAVRRVVLTVLITAWLGVACGVLEHPVANADTGTSDNGSFRLRYLADKTVVAPGTSVTYRYEISNLTTGRLYASRAGQNPARAEIIDPSGCSAVKDTPSLNIDRGWLRDDATTDFYIAPGGTAWLVCTTTINQTTTSTAQLSGMRLNTDAAGDFGVANDVVLPESASATETVMVTSQADYIVSGEGSPNTIAPGGEVIWRIEVRNGGAVTGSAYTFTASLASAFTGITSADGCMISGRTVTCSGQPGLAAQRSRTYTITARAGPTTSGATVNTMTVSETSNESSTANNQVSAPVTIVRPTTAGTSSDGDFTVTKTADRSTVPAGGAQVTYTYVVTNNRGDRRQYYYAARDDKCSPVSSVAGLSRVWDYRAGRYFYYIPAGRSATFRCATYVSQTTTNTVSVTLADTYRYTTDGGISYPGASTATVEATVTRSLPTGIDYESCSTLWYSTDSRSGGTRADGVVGVIDASTGATTSVFDISAQTKADDVGSAALAMAPSAPNRIFFIPRESTSVGSRGKGLWVYDRHTDSSRLITTDVPYGGTAVARLGADPAGALWTIAANGGVYRFDTENEADGWVSMGTVSLPAELGLNPIKLMSGDLTFDGNGTMYFITSNINAGRQVSYLFSITSAELTDGTPEARLAGRMGGDRGFNGLAFTEDGTAFGTESNSLFKVDINTGAPTQIKSPIAPLTGDLTSCALPKPDLQVTKTVTPDGPVVEGTELLYTVTVENIGSLAATSVTFRDTPEGAPVTTAKLNGGSNLGGTYYGSARPINAPGDLPGVIGPGKTATITLRATTGKGRPQVCNQSRTTFENAAGAVLSDDPRLPGGADKTCTPTYVPALSVDKTGSTDLLNSNGTDTAVTYSFAVRNIGNEPLTTVKLTDPACSPLVFTGGDTNSDSILTGDETWTYRCEADLPGTRTTQDGTSGTSVRNTAGVTGVGTQTKAQVSDQDTFLVTPPGLTFRKFSSAAGARVSPGDEITYTLTARNTTEPRKTLTHVVIRDVLPAGVTYVAGSATKTLPGGTAAPASAPPNLITAADDVTLEWGEVLTVTFRVRVDVPSGTPPASLPNYAYAYADSDQTGEVEDYVVDPVQRPYLDVAKYPGEMTGPNAQGRYEVAYTVVVSNAGPGDVMYGPLTDTPAFAANLRPVAASWAGAASGTATLTGPSHAFTLAPAGTALAEGVDHTYTVTIEMEHTGEAVERCSGSESGTHNSVSLPEGQESGAPTDNSACVEPISGFSLNKAAGGGEPGGIGTPVQVTYDSESNRYEAVTTYTVTSTNTGLADATRPEITDVVTTPSGFTVAAVALNGTAQPLGDGPFFTIPKSESPLPVGGKETFTVTVTAWAPATVTDWRFIGSCQVLDEGMDRGGIANSVETPIDTDGLGNNDACAPLVAPSTPITVVKLGSNCDVDKTTCVLPGASFALYDTDPAGGASPVAGGFTSVAGDSSRFTSVPLTHGRTYWVVETAAPAGHTLLPAPVRITVTGTGLTIADAAAHGTAVRVGSTGTLEIRDATPVALPATGGRGPWLTTVVGALLIAAAALLVGGSARANAGGRRA